ncbi:MAG: lipopolysaccharide heptosyltransferase II [Luteitalea sp.]|nr:lipopolysaccharide heptosyltransferase II [Luteitalea sp.]
MSIGRILVRAPNWLGDMVMALPAIRAVRRSAQEAHVAVAAPAGAATLFAFAPDVDEVVPLPGAKGLRGLRLFSDDVASLAAARPDVALLLTNSFSSAWAVSRAGIPERWGYRTDARGPLLTRAVRRRDATRQSAHHAEFYLALVRALGLAEEPDAARLKPRPTADLSEGDSRAPLQGRHRETDTPYLRATEEARARARERLVAHGWDPSTPLVGVAPGAAYGRAKQYPPDLMASLVGGLVSTGWTPVLIGAEEDQATGQTIVAALDTAGATRTRLVNLIGKTDLAMLVGLADLCRAFVSNDSGAMHIAAALGTPVMAIFGSTDERATAPIGPHVIVRASVWCRPCLLRECPIDHRCMRQIPPARLVQAVTELPQAAE